MAGANLLRVSWQYFVSKTILVLTLSFSFHISRVKDLIVSAQEEDKVFTFSNTSNVVILPKIKLLFNIIAKAGRHIENLKVYGFSLEKKWLPSSKKEAQQFVDLLSNQCRKLKYLSIRKMQHLDERYLSDLLEKIGPRLTGFSYDALVTEQVFELVIDKLNPEKLTDLTCLIENSKVLAMICEKFKKLKNLNMSFYKEVCLIDLDRLQLHHCSITNHNLKPTTLVSLFSSQFNNNLRFLGLESIQINSSVVCSLSNFKKLETLKILVSKQEDLDRICKSVPSLKRLVLSLAMYPNVNEIRCLNHLTELKSLEIKCRVVQKLKFEKVVMKNVRHLSLMGSSYFKERSDSIHSLLAYNFPNLSSLKYKNTNQLDDKFFKMIDEMKRLKMLICFVEQSSTLPRTIQRLRDYTNFMAIDLVLCKRKCESNSYFLADSRVLHYLQPTRSYNLPKTITFISGQ